MKGTLKIALACTAVAAAMLGGTQAQAQMMGRGSNMNTLAAPKAGSSEKKPQYIPGAKAQEKIFPLGETWTAVSFNGKPYNGNDRPSFIVDQQYRARGYGGCNTFAATAFPLREQKLAVGPLAITKKSCDKALAATEQAFFVALRTSGPWDIVGSQLVLKSQAGEIRFDRAL